jgi:hypothetical protein
MTDTAMARIDRAHIAAAKAIIPGGENMPTQAIVDHLVRAGLGQLQAAPTSALSCLQSAGRATILPCGLVLVAHWIDDRSRSLIAVGHGVWTVPLGLLPAIVEAVEAAETRDEAIGAIYRVLR